MALKMNMKPVSKLNRLFVPIGLIFISLFITYLLIEIFFFNLLLPILPLKSHWSLDPGMQVLAQYSKENLIPKNYVAIVGDSYAASKGEWYKSVKNQWHPQFQSTHLIHEKTEIDVITFGNSGAGSLRGLITEPIAQSTVINSFNRYELESPKYIIIYFYEGNDLNDNIRDIELMYRNNFNFDKIYDQDYFRSFIHKKLIDKNNQYSRKEFPTIINKMIFGKFIYRLIKANLLYINKKLFQAQNRVSAISTTNVHVNSIFVDSSIVIIPDSLQSPALELTSEELELAIYVFEQSLKYLQNAFPSSIIGLLYIPSPLSSYEIASSKVNIFCYKNRDSVYNSNYVKERSDEIASIIMNISKDSNINFLDSRDYIRKYSANTIIHGPEDWKHFNQIGYSILAEATCDLIVTIQNTPHQE